MQHLNSTPVSTSNIRIWTEQDPILAKVKRWVLSGWPTQPADEREELRPYRQRRYELSVEEGCVLWGNRVVVPPKGRDKVLSMLHEAHPGIVRMKGFARGYVWWPGLDKQLEECVKKCAICQTTRKTPPVAPLQSWSWPDKPWSRVHIDYAGHSSTGVSPAELIFGRRPRSQLDLLHPDMNRTVQRSQDRQKQSHDAHARAREFQVDDLVYARNYRRGPIWLPGMVIGRSGAVSYTVLLEDGRSVHKHIDQLRSRVASDQDDSLARELHENLEPDSELDLPGIGGGDEGIAPTQPTPRAPDEAHQQEEEPGGEGEVPSAETENPAPIPADPVDAGGPGGSDTETEQLRRSTRNRQPRDWYGNQHFF